MELISSDVVAKTKYVGHGIFTVTANNELKIEGDDDVLRAEVPSGKQWTVDAHVSITETDIE